MHVYLTLMEYSVTLILEGKFKGKNEQPSKASLEWRIPMLNRKGAGPLRLSNQKVGGSPRRRVIGLKFLI